MPEEEKKDEVPAQPPAADAIEEVPAEGADNAEEVEVFNMAEDEHYPDDHVEKPKVDSALSRRSMKFYDCFGQDSYKRYNFHYLGDSSFIYATGNTYEIYNVETMERRIFHGTDTDGIGSITVHPSRKWFAVGEKGPSPNVYVYAWPSLKLYRILRKGTDLMYAHIEFSSSGKLLASLGGAPDYTLTVWNWQQQKVVLKAKAFSSEVFRVSFSPYTDDILITCGACHIRFWKMAQTFTGLKLQGQIAKFGQLELSDTSCFYELQDGKVVSGTDQGTLIVWEGQFVKAHLMLNVETKLPLHGTVEKPATIEVLLQDDQYYVTAGSDGYIKWWKISDIDSAEADEGIDFALVPTREILIAENEEGKNPAHIMNMILAGSQWYIQDGKGKIFSMGKDSDIYNEVYNFQEGSVKDIVASPSHNFAASIGQNGMVKVWDYVKKNVFSQQTYAGNGTCLEMIPATDSNKGRCLAAGFNTGMVRIISVTAEGLEILKCFRAHEDAIIGIRYSKDLKMAVTASEAGDIFFFEIDGNSDPQKYDPLCCLKLPDNAQINDFKWNPDDESIIFGCANGWVHQIRKPKPSEIDNSDSYYWKDPPIKSWRIKIMEFQMQKNQKKDEAEEEKKRRMRLRGELPPEDEEPEEDWEPESIRTIMPYTTADGKQQFIVSSQGQFNGFIYVCSIDEIRPLKAIPIQSDLLVTYMQHSIKSYGEMITIGYQTGGIELVMNGNFDKRMLVKYHDGHNGSITAVTMTRDNNFFLSSADDGLIYVFQFDQKCAMAEAAHDALAGVEGANFMAQDDKEALRARKTAEYFEHSPAIFPETDELCLDESALAITIKTKDVTGMDFIEPPKYSIQQDKLRSEEDHRINLAEKKKSGVRDQINKLRDWFKKVNNQNVGAEPHLQASDDDFQIDPEFFAVLFDRNEANIAETKKEVAWRIEFHTVALNKLKFKYYDVLEFEKFTVKSIKNGSYVTTFRVQKMSEFLQKNIESFKQMLENEIIGKDADADDDFIDDGSKDDNKVDNERQKEKEKAAALAAKQKAAQQAALNAKKSEGEKKREQRKLEREDRKRLIEKFEKQEAMHSGEDPEDRKEIDIAQATFGDFKLKISPDYTVPENQRVNFAKKRQQMVLLEGSIHKLKVDFNQKIQELKIRKKEIVDHVGLLNSRLQEINKELKVEEDLFLPTIDKDVEYPENFFEIQDSDIVAFKAKKEAEKNKDKKGVEQPEEEEGEKDEDAEEEFDIKTMALPARKNAKVQSSEIDTEFAQIRKIELIYEKEQKKKEIDDITTAFDEEIREMQKEKYRLESDLKNAEMKLIVFFEELILLKSMESKDIQLTKRLAGCRQEKGQILKEINEISRKLKEKKKEIDEIKEKEEDLMSRFHELCPERSDKYEEIRKYFEKILKRRRRVEKPERAEGDEDDDEEDAEEEEEMEEEEDEDEDENTVAGLPPEEYKIEEIDKLREERMDLYEDKEKILQFINDLEVQRKRLENKEKAIKSDLEETEEEIQDFQSEKMSKLNQLQVSIVLKVKQVQNLQCDQQRFDYWKTVAVEEINCKMEAIQNKVNQEGNDDPMYLEQQRELLNNEEDWRGYNMAGDLKKSIMFTRTQLLQLINRKRELDEEQISLNKAFRDYKKDWSTKKREIKENEKIRELKERDYNERQMLRFGNLVDLDNLEVSGPSGVVLELQNKFAKTEKRCIMSIENAEGEFDQTQRELTSEMKNNTNLLNLIRQLGEEELDLDEKLDDSNKAIFVDEGDEKKRHIMEEKLKIKKLLEIQAKEIETFKTEINMYKRKGGHIYTKVTTNRRVANLNQDN